MNRLILAIGTWQLILAASAIRQATAELNTSPNDYLILSGPRLSDEMKKNMMQIASVVWNWQAIVWADDLLDFNLPNLTNKNFSEVAKIFKNRTKLENCDEVWLCRLTENTEKFIAEAYKKAAIVIYEDGLHSYVSRPFVYVRKKQRLENSLNFFRGKSYNLEKINKQGLVQNHLNRVKTGYFFLSKILDLPSYFSKQNIISIAKKEVLDVLDIINNKTELKQNLKIENNDRNSILVLGQCFSNNRHMISWEEELIIYQKACLRISELGFIPLWKEHPRNNTPFFNLLAEKIPETKELNLNVHYSWPIELFIKQLNLKGCISATSTSLFYIKELFDFPIYTFASDLPDFSAKDFLDMKNLTIGKIPSFFSL